MNTNDVLSAIDRMRRQGNDDAKVEAKSCESELSKDVWESVSAFANTGGGLLVLGLDERGGFVPVRKFALDRVRDQFVSGIGDGGSDNARLTNPPHYEMLRVELEGSQVLAINVHELDSRLKPCFITRRGMQTGSYKRVDDKDIRLSPTEIYELSSMLLPSRADAEPVSGACLDDLDLDAVDAYVAREARSGSRMLRGATTQEQQLSRLGVTNRSGDVLMAGLLAFGYYPQQYFPLLVIDVAIHPQNSKGRGGAVRFVDRAICEGPLADGIDQAVAAVLRNTRNASVVMGTRRMDVPEIPEEVLREALANAVVHREYSDLFVGQSVTVDVYPNRVEVTSPGGLWGGKTIENLGDGQSRCRNGALVKLMRMPTVAYGEGVRVEGQGSGIPMMRYEMSSRGLAEPVFEAGNDYFKVTFHRAGAGWRPDNHPRLGADSSRSDAVIITLLDRENPLTAQELAEESGLKLDTVRGHLRRLIAAGRVVATAPPTSRARKYLLV